jgi:hypothetical protein
MGAMTDADTRPAGRAGLRKAVLDRCVAMLDRHLPESGELGAWKLGQMELALLDDVNEIARDVIEARIGADPNRTVEKPKCPECGLALGGVKRERATHKQTLFGPIRYGRTYGTCQACGLAFSPSGEVFRLRQGLL